MPTENFVSMHEVMEWLCRTRPDLPDTGWLDVEQEYLPVLGLSPDKYRLEQTPTCLGWLIHRR